VRVPRRSPLAGACRAEMPPGGRVRRRGPDEDPAGFSPRHSRLRRRGFEESASQPAHLPDGLLPESVGILRPREAVDVVRQSADGDQLRS